MVQPRLSDAGRLGELQSAYTQQSVVRQSGAQQPLNAFSILKHASHLTVQQAIARQCKRMQHMGSFGICLHEGHLPLFR